MTRDFLRGDPDRVTALLVAEARADRPPSEARKRAVRRVLAGVALGTPALTGTAAAAGKLTLTASSLAPFALTGAALGVVTAGVLGVSAHWLNRSSTPSSEARTLKSGAPSASAAPAPRLAQKESVLPDSSPIPHPAERAAPERATRSTPVADLHATPPSSAPAVADFAPPKVASSQLERELSLLDEVRTNLASRRLPLAEQALARYERQFANGAMQVEATALRVELLCLLGRNEEARTLGFAFLTRYPSSPSAARVRSLLARTERNKR